MFRAFLPAQRNGRKGFSSSFALAVALAGGSVVGLAATAAPAYAKEKKEKEAKAEYSPGFVKAYQAMNEINGKANDAASAQPLVEKIPGLLEEVKTDDDKFAAGQLILNIGGKTKDTKLQRQGLMLQLESGKVDDEHTALFNDYVGSLSWEMKDYPTARTYLKKAIDLGYKGDNVERLLAETYFVQNQNAEGLAALKQILDARGTLPEDTIRRALQVAYENKMADSVDDWAADLVRLYPKQDTWHTAIAVVIETYNFSSQESLDMLRLMKRTGGLTTGREYVDYIEAADPRRMANEVLPLINEATSKGLLDQNDVFLKDAKATAEARAPGDRKDAPGLAKDARTAADGVPARAAGDLFMSLNEPAQAEEMYDIALQKGNVENDRVLTRLGIVEVDQGKFDAARANFQKITGIREPIAKMWLAYIDSKTNPPAAAAPADTGEAK